MTTRKITVSTDAHQRDLTLASANALFGLAMSRVGASVSELERGEIALGELIDTVEQTAPVTEVALDGTDDGFCLTVTFEPRSDGPELDEGARQVIDAGLSDWNLSARTATVAISASRLASDHE